MLNTMANSCGRFILFLTLLLLYVPAIRAQSNAAANYKARCADCHGSDGNGGTPAGKATKVRDFHAPVVQKETLSDLVNIITNGKNRMPKYGDKLKEPEIKDLAAYVQALGKK